MKNGHISLLNSSVKQALKNYMHAMYEQETELQKVKQILTFKILLCTWVKLVDFENLKIRHANQYH